MSTPSRPDTAAFEREWDLQERALREERLGLSSEHADAHLLRYRQLSRCLLQPLPQALPADFAAGVMQRLAADAEAARARDRRFERGLVAVLVAAFGLAVGAMIVLFGSDWLQPLLPYAQKLASPWLLALLACVGVSRLFDGWRGHSH